MCAMFAVWARKSLPWQTVCALVISIARRTHWIHEGVVSGIAGYGNPLGIPNLAGDVYYDPAYNENCLVTVVTLGVVREDHVIHSYAPANADDYVFILVGKPTDNSGFGGASICFIYFA